MNLKELAEMICRFDESEGLSSAALWALKDFASKALAAQPVVLSDEQREAIRHAGALLELEGYADALGGEAECVVAVHGRSFFHVSAVLPGGTEPRPEAVRGYAPRHRPRCR